MNTKNHLYQCLVDYSQILNMQEYLRNSLCWVCGVSMVSYSSVALYSFPVPIYVTMFLGNWMLTLVISYHSFTLSEWQSRVSTSKFE